MFKINVKKICVKKEGVLLCFFFPPVFGQSNTPSLLGFYCVTLVHGGGG